MDGDEGEEPEGVEAEPEVEAEAEVEEEEAGGRAVTRAALAASGPPLLVRPSGPENDVIIPIGCGGGGCLWESNSCRHHAGAVIAQHNLQRNSMG